GWVRGCLEECGCFGEMLQRSPGQAAVEDLILLALLVLAYRWSASADPKRAVRRKQVLGVVAVLVIAAVANGWSGVPSHSEVMDAQVAGLRNRTVTEVPGPKQVFPLPRKPTIVVFMSTRCPHCIRAVPRFNELYTKREQMEFRAFAVNADARIAEFRKRFRAVFPILQADRKQLRHLVHGVPEVLLVKDHKVVEAWALPPTIDAVRAAEYMAGEEQPEPGHEHEH
ncbi:MAG: TlpA family protein disulfide reductase, partial [Armatimonadota bacterium]